MTGISFQKFLGFRQRVSEACPPNKNAAGSKASGIMNDC
jgi:hypothetical protein